MSSSTSPRIRYRMVPNKDIEETADRTVEGDENSDDTRISRPKFHDIFNRKT